MAKAIYTGVSGVARKVKAPYIGVSGVARNGKAGYIGVAGIARQFYEAIEAGHYWVLDESSTREYSASGILLKTNSGKPTLWICPSSGGYTLEIHGRGGYGGGNSVDYFSNRVVGYSGSGGGGSGVIFTVNNLVSGMPYSIHLGDYANFDGIYIVNNGGRGQTDYPGNTAAFENKGTAAKVQSIASKGDYGSSQSASSESQLHISGGAGGSGGATVGSYGDGGQGDGFPNSGTQPKGPGIIIRKL